MKTQTVKLVLCQANLVILVKMGFGTGTKTAQKPVYQVARSVTNIQEVVPLAFRDYGVKTVHILAATIVASIAVFWMVNAKHVKTAIGVTRVSTCVMVLAVIIQYVRKPQGTANYVKPIFGEISVIKIVTSATVLAKRHVLKLRVRYVIRVVGINGASNVRRTVLNTVRLHAKQAMVFALYVKTDIGAIGVTRNAKIVTVSNVPRPVVPVGSVCKATGVQVVKATAVYLIVKIHSVTGNLENALSAM